MKTFLVWCPDRGESIGDAVEINECAAEEAAIAWAETDDNDSDQYVIVKGEDEPVVYVLDKATPNAKPQRFRVAGEYIPTYYADEEEEPKP